MRGGAWREPGIPGRAGSAKKRGAAAPSATSIRGKRNRTLSPSGVRLKVTKLGLAGFSLWFDLLRCHFGTCV